MPDAEVGIVVAGRLGEREHVQRVGRLLRPGEGKRALVYELVVRASSEVGQAARRVERSLADLRVPFSVRNGVGRIEHLGPHDHAWLGNLIGEFLRFEGKQWRELEQRLREPLGLPAAPMKLAASVKVLKKWFRTEERRGFDAVRSRCRRRRSWRSA